MKASPKAVRRDLIEFAIWLTRDLDEAARKRVASNEDAPPHYGNGTTCWMLTRLCEINNALDALNEAACNVGLTTRQESRSLKLANEALEIVNAFGPGFGLKIEHDPRGVPLKVVLPSGRSNSWGGEGWCVPLTR